MEIETARKKANQWLASKNLDEESRKEINLLLENEAELQESFIKDLEFGTGGMRGIMGLGTNRMNKYTIGMATQGFANFLKKNNGQNKVAIAHDSRNNSRFFAEVTAAVFSANNIDAYLFESLRPTPELSFAIRELGCTGGVVITASHNPKEYNGYKAYGADGGQLISPDDKKVVDEVTAISGIDDIKFDPIQDLIHPLGKELDESYKATLKSLSLSPESISAQKDLKIVYSSIHGTGITMVPDVLRECGFENVITVKEQEEADGNFPTVVYPNPEEKEAMTLALNYAKKHDADLVMATDPDTDRVGIAIKNQTGEFQLLNGNQTGALLVYYLLTKWNEKGLKGNEFIAKTIVTTELIKRIAGAFNVKCYDTLTGFKYIAELIRIKEGKEVFIGGGEESYGYLIGDKVRDKDAVASCLMIAEMTAWIKQQGKDLFALLLEVYEQYGLFYEELKSITKKGLSGAEEIAKMMEDFRNAPPKNLAGSKVTEVIDYTISERRFADGRTEQIDLPKSNVLQFKTEDGTKVSIRPSGTEPKIKFYFSVVGELAGGSYTNEIEKLRSKVHKLLNDLHL
jgi:phosphoglucomutase